MRFLLFLIAYLMVCPQPAAATEVFIYYANEPTEFSAEEQNLRAVIRWLLDSQKPLPRRIAELLAEDRKLFPEAVERDVLQLQTRLSEDPAWREHGVIVFTNKLARQGRALVHQPGHVGLTPIDFSPNSPSNVILAAQPLSDFLTLREALRLTAATFPQASSVFAAVFKTHATRSLAVTPFAGLVADEGGRADFLARLPQDDRSAPELSTIGIDRHEFLAALESSGLRWGGVFLDAVYNAPEFERLVRVSRSSVSKYATIPYAAWSPDAAAGGLVGSLERSFLAQQRVEREGGSMDGATSALRYLLLMPLLIGTGLLLWILRRNR